MPLPYSAICFLETFQTTRLAKMRVPAGVEAIRGGSRRLMQIQSVHSQHRGEKYEDPM